MGKPAGSIDVAEMIARQRELAGRLITRDDLPAVPEVVAGVDAAFPRGRRVTRAAAVLMRLPGLEIIDRAVAERPTTLPYVPGLLSFRELPAITAALDGLSRPPDLVLCDGQGLAHPRRFGIACHLGLTAGLPTIGVGKSRLCGRHEQPGHDKGESSDLFDGDEIIGRVVRTRDGVHPLYISVGHRVGLERAVAMVLACTPRYRLPEPIRRADRLAGGG